MTIVDIDTNEEEKLVVSSQGSATGLNLKEGERIYFGGLPTIGNYRYVLCRMSITSTVGPYATCLFLMRTHTHAHTSAHTHKHGHTPTNTKEHTNHTAHQFTNNTTTTKERNTDD